MRREIVNGARSDLLRRPDVHSLMRVSSNFNRYRNGLDRMWRHYMGWDHTHYVSSMPL